MFEERVLRGSGLLAVVAGVAWSLYEIAEVAGIISVMLDARLDLFAHSLIALAAIGIYARVAGSAGVFGLVAFSVYMLMVLANTAMKTIYTIVIPVLANSYPEAGSAIGATSEWVLFTGIWTWLTILGPILFGGALIASGEMPRWAGALLVVGPIVSLSIGPILTSALGLAGNLGAIISAAGWIAVGIATARVQTQRQLRRRSRLAAA